MAASRSACRICSSPATVRSGADIRSSANRSLPPLLPCPGCRSVTGGRRVVALAGVVQPDFGDVGVCFRQPGGQQVDQQLRREHHSGHSELERSKESSIRDPPDATTWNSAPSSRTMSFSSSRTDCAGGLIMARTPRAPGRGAGRARESGRQVRHEQPRLSDARTASSDNHDVGRVGQVQLVVVLPAGVRGHSRPEVLLHPFLRPPWSSRRSWCSVPITTTRCDRRRPTRRAADRRDAHAPKWRRGSSPAQDRTR